MFGNLSVQNIKKGLFQGPFFIGVKQGVDVCCTCFWLS